MWLKKSKCGSKEKILHELWAFTQTPPPPHTHTKLAHVAKMSQASCDHYNFAEFRPNTFILGAYTAQCIMHHHHHLSLNREGRLGTTNDFTTSFLHFPLFSTALWDLPNSGPVHCLMSSHLFLCLPCLLPPFTVPYKMVLASPDEQET